MDPDVSRLQSKLAELRRRDTQFRVFGASTHRYLLHPCLSEHQVQEAEARYGITLPEDYRRFLLFLGNGGAGPEYGIFPLENSLEHSVKDIRLLREPFPHVQAWNLTPHDVGQGGDNNYAAFEEAYFQETYVQGALQINEVGSGTYTLLVITGRERGYLWSNDRASDAGIGPLRGPHDRNGRLSFFAWYDRWLDRSLDKAT